MTSPNMPAGRTRESGLTVDAARLWPGGIATAVVAALIALVGVMVSRWLFKIPLLAPRSDGAYGDAHTTGLVLAAAGAALVATALVHLLPFSTSAPLTAKVATALVDLVLGIAIGSLINSVAARSLQRPRAARRDQAPDPMYDSVRTTTTEL
jgi:hypothetical protein